MKFYAVIVAGGSGNRMNSKTPKQFLLLGGKPVLMHTIEAFYLSELAPRIIVVLNRDYDSFWKKQCEEHDFKVPHTVVSGGKERFDSVRNALDLVPENSIVGIHDAVRPVVTNELITRCFREAEIYGAVIPVTGSRDSLRKKENGITYSINRQDVLIVQTPQVFKSELLKKAYQQEFSAGFTDDASVVETLGVFIHITEGDVKNIKVTYPEDLKVASLFLNLKA